jgi:hypothetical protein
MGNFDPRVHVGLPAAVTRVDVEVRWPSGAVSHAREVPVDGEIALAEP